jgi:hypothetical protein
MVTLGVRKRRRSDYKRAQATLGYVSVYFGGHDGSIGVYIYQSSSNCAF